MNHRSDRRLELPPEQQAIRASDEDLAQMLREVEAMTAEEAQQRLDEVTKNLII
jgi:hypothetical protein